MPPNMNSIRRNAVPFVLTSTIVAGGGLALAESVSADKLAQPTAITRDIGTLPTAAAFNFKASAPELVAGESPFANSDRELTDESNNHHSNPSVVSRSEFTATTSTKPNQKSTYSMVDDSTGPISTRKAQSLSDKCKRQSTLAPGSPGPHHGLQDNTKFIHARASQNVDLGHTFYFTMLRKTVLCKILGSMKDDESGSLYYINPIKVSKTKGKIVDRSGDFYDLAAITILGRPQISGKK